MAMSLVELIQGYGYWAVAAGAFLEGETMLLVAGAAASRGHLSLPAVVAVAALASLGDDLRFVLICSKVSVAQGADAIAAEASTQKKCERCWHYREDVGSNPEHPELCGRCDSNLHGEGEVRERA